MSSVPKPTQDLIESKIDKGIAGSLQVGGGLVQFGSMAEVMEFAKVMAISGQAVPPHLRNQVGFCLAIIIQAIEWRFSPFAVANKSYVVNDRIGYEAQLIHAVIEQRAPIVGRVQHKFKGEGDKLQCIVWAQIRGLEKPCELTSPPIGQITPKNSPLWKCKPEQQLFYNTVRDWARRNFPDVLLGVYTDDELEDSQDFPQEQQLLEPTSQTKQLEQTLAALNPVQTVTVEEKEPAQ